MWKELFGFKKKCEVSDSGLVKIDGVIKKGYKDTKGYLQISIGGKRYMIHRLIAQAFIQNPHNLPQINHKDENKTNNAVSNLEWCSCRYNCRYGTKLQRQVKTAKKRGTISRPSLRKKLFCVELNLCFNSYKDAALYFKVDKSMMSHIGRGLAKSCCGYTFKRG